MLTTATSIDLYTKPFGVYCRAHALRLFTRFIINMFLSVSNIKSSSVAELSINATTKQAVVRYHGSDRPYLYTGVDFNALYTLMYNQVDSIGQWVNKHLKNVASVECFAV